ncbi:UNVERIFIED_CONTAM: hypothetical protein RMT77_008555 [Armadillidium vulgare]
MSSDREKRIKTLRRDLEGWREILVVIHSLLIWEKQYYPAITASVISFIYLLVWYIDPAVLTFISTVGLLAVLSDFLLPTAISYIHGADYWTGSHERKYEQIVTYMAGSCESFTHLLSSFHTIKTSRPKTYFVAMTAFLVCSAWIGSSVNNLFLTYLIVLLAALYPGLRRQDVVKKHFASFMQNIAKILKGSSPGNVGDQGDRPVKKD